MNEISVLRAKISSHWTALEKKVLLKEPKVVTWKTRIRVV